MEGHEPSDWSSYYAEPEVGTRLFQGEAGWRRPLFSPTSTASLAGTRPPTPSRSGQPPFPPSFDSNGSLFYTTHC